MDEKNDNNWINNNSLYIFYFGISVGKEQFAKDYFSYRNDVINKQINHFHESFCKSDNINVGYMPIEPLETKYSLEFPLNLVVIKDDDFIKLLAIKKLANNVKESNLNNTIKELRNITCSCVNS